MSSLMPGSRAPGGSNLIIPEPFFTFTLDEPQETAPARTGPRLDCDWPIWFEERINHRLHHREQPQNRSCPPLLPQAQRRNFPSAIASAKRGILRFNIATQMFNVFALWFINDAER